ncbi:MAG: hypothetical protein ACI95C_001036 [Pseudohongiellaceae bacterium]|jgi:hypothetical protein
MSWDAIGAIGEILGAAVVVATIFYLAIQIRQSQSANQMATAARIAGTADAWIGQLVRDKELNDLYQNGMRDYNSLDLSDRSRFDLLIAQLLRAMESAWTQEKHGGLDQNQWYGYKMTTRHVVGSPGGLAVFNKMKNTAFSPEFSAAIHEIISNTDDRPQQV